MAVVLFCVFLLCISLSGSHATRNSSDALERVEQTVGGLFYYYWAHDTYAKAVEFFFACGQIGGMGDRSQPKKCYCYSRTACENCYRWWDAVALEAVANHAIYTKNRKKYAHVPKAIFSHSPYNSKWNAQTALACTYIDDFAWYGIAYLRVYEWLKDPFWLQQSVALYNWTMTNGWDGDCGGILWNVCGNLHFKDSITIMEVLHLGAKLSYLFPNNTWFYSSALRIWDWVFSFDGGRGLMSEQYLVSTGAVPEMCCNSSVKNPFRKCFNSNVSGTSYNQGLLLSSAAYLYKRTHNHTYLDVGKRALEAVFENYTTKEGILVDEPRSYQTYQDQCMVDSDPGGDWYSFQGIFMNHLGYFTTLLSDGVSLSKDTLTKIKTFVYRTSDAAWTRSAVKPPFKDTDACNTNPLNVSVSYPKFHWWWGKDVTQQRIPPDPHLFFHKTNLRCVTSNGNDTQLWEGLLDSEDTCQTNCSKNKNCSKYLFQNDQVAVPGTNCWTWSYNRSDHTCHQEDANFNVGIKRPIGNNATCAGRCGSSEPVSLEHGMCYCNSDCVNHLDCCLDYADQCLPPDYIPSCSGVCDKLLAHAIPGGGYCWCMNGCNPSYTDNNSDGSCCPDYSNVCQKMVMPTCLDARSQGSALNLFLTHLKLTQL